jgi:hypothetical protein
MARHFANPMPIISARYGNNGTTLGTIGATSDRNV